MADVTESDGILGRVQNGRRRVTAFAALAGHDSVADGRATIGRGRNLQIFSLCLVSCFLYQFFCMNTSVGLYDEGVILFDAMRVADGDVPHRDFYANYGPGQFYVLAGLFKLFSPSVLIERIWDSVAKSISVGVVFLVVVRSTGTVVAGLVTAIACTVWFAFLGTYGYPDFPALAAALTSLACIFSVFSGGRSAWQLLAAGACAGLTFLFRYDVGAFTFLALELLLGLCVVSQSRATGALRDLARVAVLFFTGFASVMLPVFVAFVVYGVVGDLFFDVIIFPSEHYPQTRSLPFPDIRALAYNPANAIVYLPLILSVAAVPAILAAKRRSSKSVNGRSDGLAMSAGFWMMISLVIMTLVYFGKGVVRVSPIHMAMAIITSLTLAGIAVTKISAFGRVPRGILDVALLMTALCTLVAFIGNAHEARRNLLAMMEGDFWAMPVAHGKSPGASCRVPIGLERLACFSIDRNHMDAIRFLQERARPGDYIYVGLGRHDKILMNDVALYFLSEFRSITKWHHFDPGLQTSETVQLEMVNELERYRPRFVVLESQWDDAHEPNASAVSSGIRTLDDYIGTHFKPVATYGAVSIREDAGGQ